MRRPWWLSRATCLAPPRRVSVGALCLPRLLDAAQLGGDELLGSPERRQRNDVIGSRCFARGFASQSRSFRSRGVGENEMAQADDVHGDGRGSRVVRKYLVMRIRQAGVGLKRVFRNDLLTRTMSRGSIMRYGRPR